MVRRRFAKPLQLSPEHTRARCNLANDLAASRKCANAAKEITALLERESLAFVGRWRTDVDCSAPGQSSEGRKILARIGALEQALSQASGQGQTALRSA
jgi:hypothetical protein